MVSGQGFEFLGYRFEARRRGVRDKSLKGFNATHDAWMPHLPATPMPTHENANPVALSLLGFEAIVFVTKYLAHLPQQALGNWGRWETGFTASKPCIKQQN